MPWGYSWLTCTLPGQAHLLLVSEFNKGKQENQVSGLTVDNPEDYEELKKKQILPQCVLMVGKLLLFSIIISLKCPQPSNISAV